MMTTEQRLILCVVLSMVVVFTFSWLNKPTEAELARQRQLAEQRNQSVSQPAIQSVTREVTASEVTASPTQPEVSPEQYTTDTTSESSITHGWSWLPQTPPANSAKTIVVESDLYRVQFSSHGAAPFSWELKNFDELYSEPRYLKLAAEHSSPYEQKKAQYEYLRYAETKDQDPPPIQMVNQVFAPGQNGLVLRWGKTRSDQNIDYQSDQLLYKVFGAEPVEVRFSSENKGVVIEKIYTFYPDVYHLDFAVSITNNTGQDIEFPKNENVYDLNWFGGVGNPTLRMDAQNEIHYEIDQSHTFYPALSVEGILGKQINDLLPEYNRMAAFVQHADPLNPDTINWVGVGQKYFLSAIVPKSKTKRAIMGLSSTNSTNIADRKPFMGLRILLPPSLNNFSYTDEFILYVGPKDERNLLTAESGLEDAQQLFLKRFTGPIVYLMLGLLNFLYGLVPDYGISIILLTLMIKIIMLPLYHKQVVQMRKMQAIQPQITELKEKFKDDPQKMQQEQFALFKKHKVNPLGGCLPILPTIPIFIALYATFAMAVELRGAEGLYGLISDLSRPDYAFFIPFAGWIIPINILPIAYCLLMLWSMSLQKIEGPNAVAMKIMPLMFVFIFWSMASGVILYFVISIFIDVLQRKIIEKIQKSDLPATPAKA